MASIVIMSRGRRPARRDGELASAIAQPGHSPQGDVDRSKWSPDEFRNPRYAKGWREADGVPGWYADGKLCKVLHDLVTL